MTFPFLSCAKSISSNIQTSDRIGGVPARDFPKCFRGWVLSVTGFVNQKLHPGWRRCWLSQSVEMVQHFPPENIHSFLYRCFCSCYWQLFPLNIYRHTTYTLSPHKYLNYSNIEVEGRRRQWLALNLHSIPCIWLVHIFDHSLFFSNSAAIGTSIMRPQLDDTRIMWVSVQPTEMLMALKSELERKCWAKDCQKHKHPLTLLWLFCFWRIITRVEELWILC